MAGEYDYFAHGMIGNSATQDGKRIPLLICSPPGCVRLAQTRTSAYYATVIVSVSLAARHDLSVTILRPVINRDAVSCQKIMCGWSVILGMCN